MRLLLPLVASLALSGPALGCINDTGLVNHEREFRSQYRESEYQPPSPEPQASAQPYVLGGAGAMMAVAGLALFLRIRSQA